VAWKGKAIGFLLGLLTRRPQFMVLGLILGHLYDMGIFRRRMPPPAPAAPAGIAEAYAELGISPSATDDQVEQAFRRLISEYHPDRVANAAQEIRDLAEARARTINTAYEAIRRDRHRDA